MGIAASAVSLGKLFSEAVRGCAAIVLDSDPPESTDDRVPIEAHGDDLAALLAAVLEESLWMIESTGALPVGASLEIEPGVARGWLDVVRGAELRGPQIKAVTYHQLSVTKEEGGWRATVYFDV